MRLCKRSTRDNQARRADMIIAKRLHKSQTLNNQARRADMIIAVDMMIAMI